MKKIIYSLIFGLMVSTFHAAPVKGQEINGIQSLNNGFEECLLTNVKTKTMLDTKYSIAQLNIRSVPSVSGDIVGILSYNSEVEVTFCDDKWDAVVEGGKIIGYVRNKYLSLKKQYTKFYEIPEYSGMKSWMDYRKITDISSEQYKLQNDYAYTGTYGIRMVDGRFCVAIGFAFDPHIGQYFDLVLKNGTVIPCVISDEKKTTDCTDDLIFTAETDCCTEFVVDIDSLNNSATKMGDISYSSDEWDSPVEYIKIYNKNVLEE